MTGDGNSSGSIRRPSEERARGIRRHVCPAVCARENRVRRGRGTLSLILTHSVSLSHLHSLSHILRHCLTHHTSHITHHTVSHTSHITHHTVSQTYTLLSLSLFPFHPHALSLSLSLSLTHTHSHTHIPVSLISFHSPQSVYKTLCFT